MTFHGQTYQPELDFQRLATQLDLVRTLMLDGWWRTLAQIRAAIGKGTEASISARLRDLRRPEHGAYTVERRRKGHPKGGLFEYRVVR